MNTATTPCSLDKEGVLAYLRSLRPQDGGAYADAVEELARTVRERQIEIAGAEWEQCRLWRDGYDRPRGIINKDGQLRIELSHASADVIGLTSHLAEMERLRNAAEGRYVALQSRRTLETTLVILSSIAAVVIASLAAVYGGIK